MSFEKAIPVKINGVPGELLAPANETLLDCLRRHGQFDVKNGCEKGDCGACAVQIDGEAVDRCLTLTWTVEGRSITTLAGLNDINKPHPLIAAFIEQGAVQCGYCIPGIIVAAEALFLNTSQLRRVELVAPQTAIGKNTSASLQSGLVFGYAGLVEGLVARFKRELGDDAKVIGTGGQAGIIAHETDVFDEINPDLTLVGLRLIYNMNQPSVETTSEPLQSGAREA